MGKASPNHNTGAAIASIRMPRKSIEPMPGTALWREYKGRQICVIVLPRGTNLLVLAIGAQRTLLRREVFSIFTMAFDVGDRRYGVGADVVELHGRACGHNRVIEAKKVPYQLHPRGILLHRADAHLVVR